ncbi:DUF5050 domain-containing protein [Serpentinicella alkaliphila]|uniref:LysM domain-containing protein n=1 Tax=Serpentinicella alkaliphila TaxID=1734049 RepID=A0A4R2T0N8_9FIRM|nr:DUF5050 domain-containing protein [Serpentinicella alkaliphila]QUH26525.1 DUF5050 domain-containing protein [Serpentinicella alkaliphila]TCP94851.1 LysM domain-containing protein [Serpentinicella alkaliphila]
MTIQYSKVYTVKSGDSIYSIAQEHYTTIDKLMIINMLESPILTLGQQLYIPIQKMTGINVYTDNKFEEINTNQMAYRPVTAYTATRPIIVNGVDINTGLYPVLNYQPQGAEFPYIYVPIAEFRRVGAMVRWDEARQIMFVTTDYAQRQERVRTLEAENAYLKLLLGGAGTSSITGVFDETNNEVEHNYKIEISQSRQYVPVIAYTATRPILVNGVDINTGLYHVLNFQPPGAEYPFIYVPIAEFRRVGARVVWDDTAQIMIVTTDYYILGERIIHLEAENLELRRQLEGTTPGARGNIPDNIRNGGFTAQQGNWVYYGRHRIVIQLIRDLTRNTLDNNIEQKLGEDDPSYINVLGEWVYYRHGMDNGRLYRRSITGLNPTPLTNEPVFNVLVVNGWIYYLNVNDNFTLYRIRIDGTGRMKINNDYSGSVNVVGEWIYYSNIDDQGRMYKIRVDGTGRQKISDFSAFKLSVHGNWMYYRRADDEMLYRSSIDGTNAIRLSNDLIYEFVVFGDYIYYLIQNPPGGDLYRMKLDGSEKTYMRLPDNITQLNIHPGWIYWISGSGTIYKTPIGGGGSVSLYRP